MSAEAGEKSYEYPGHFTTISPPIGMRLPRDPFKQQAPIEVKGTRIELTQWASPVAVRPIAKLAVAPDDFHLLHLNGGP